MEQSLQRVKVWKQWLLQNGNQFEINGNAIFTSREDREMLSIGLRIKKDITLGEKEILNTLIPLLDELHECGAIVERIILYEWVKRLTDRFTLLFEE